MEDRWSIIVDSERGIAVFGVFDGHGGQQVSIALQQLPKTLLEGVAALAESEQGYQARFGAPPLPFCSSACPCPISSFSTRPLLPNGSQRIQDGALNA